MPNAVQYESAPAPTKDELGSLSNLATTNKTSAVAAINEVNNNLTTLSNTVTQKQDKLTRPVCSSVEIEYTIVSAVAGTDYAMFTASDYVPAGKSFIGVYLTNSPAGNYDVDGGVIKYRGSNVVYYTPSTSQPGIVIKCRVLYC